jgi:hypothetical protein
VSHCVSQAGFTPAVLLPLPPKCWITGVHHHTWCALKCFNLLLHPTHIPIGTHIRVKWTFYRFPEVWFCKATSFLVSPCKF